MHKRILILVDQRAVSNAAIRAGLAEATAHGADVLFFYLLPRYSVPLGDGVPFVGVSPQDFQGAAMAMADKRLDAAQKAADKAGVVSQRAIGSAEDDARCIADAARRRRCQMIVAASEGRNALLRLLTGSVIPGLITSSPVPVLVVKDATSDRAAARSQAAPLKTRTKRPTMALPPVQRRRKALA